MNSTTQLIFAIWFICTWILWAPIGLQLLYKLIDWLSK